MKVLLTATVQSHICQFHKPLVEMLHENGCEVHVAARNNLAEKNGLALDFADRVFDVPFSRSPKSVDNFKALKHLKRIISTGDYDIIHCNTPMGSIVTRLAAIKARKKGTKVYYTAHGFHFYSGAPKKNWLVFYPVEKFFSRLTDIIVTITEEDFKLATNNFHCTTKRIHGVGVDEKRYFPIPDADALSLRRKMHYDENCKIILCIGELLPNKNQQMAIRMMKKIIADYPDALLLIAGNGPEHDNLLHMISENHLEANVSLLGYVTNLQDYQRISDVCISCSKREGLPVNIVEAMLSATPVVATTNRGHRELIHDGETGYMVAVDDADSMYQKVSELLADSEKYNKIVCSAKSFAEKYTASSVRSELAELYGFNQIEEHNI